ncbi:MAG TPA: hypothetical protein VNO32_45730, partial [Candidatus Acidoferrum sp.]|nr:hypothetical protein [Candidatus Acidoferrum sp.]
SDASKVPATGSHGTDLFQRHPELPTTIVDWFVTTLIRTPGHAPADAVASVAILNQIEMPGWVARVTQQLMEARRKDPKAQLWPEANVDIIGEDHMREADAEKKAGHLREAEIEMKGGIEIFKLNLLAYPSWLIRIRPTRTTIWPMRTFEWERTHWRASTPRRRWP